jgi:tripartite-type tricarboxylate transporter receptor subunit TctC
MEDVINYYSCFDVNNQCLFCSMIIVPWPAGNANDILARLLAAPMEKELGTPVEIVNKPGASTQIGMTQLVKAKPDGHTLALNTCFASVLIYQDPDRKAIFSRKDFTPVAVALVDSFNMSSKSDGPYKTVKDLVEAAKAAPKKIKIGGSGYMTATHMASLALQRAAGVQFAMVHFESSPQAVAALLGGHVDAAVGPADSALGAYKSGSARILGIMSRERSRYFPGVQTFPEQGYNVIMEVSRGIAGPGGMRREIVETLNEMIKRITASEEFRKKAEAAGLNVRYMDTREYIAHWDDLDVGLKPLLDEAKAERATQK